MPVGKKYFDVASKFKLKKRFDKELPQPNYLNSSDILDKGSERSGIKLKEIKIH